MSLSLGQLVCGSFGQQLVIALVGLSMGRFVGRSAMSQLVHGSVGQSVHGLALFGQSVGWTMGRSINLSVCHWFGRSVRSSISPSVGLSVHRSVGWSVGQSQGGHSFGKRKCQGILQLLPCGRSVSQSIPRIYILCR